MSYFALGLEPKLYYPAVLKTAYRLTETSGVRLLSPDTCTVQDQALKHITKFGYVATAAVTLATLTAQASSEDLVKLAVGQRGTWGSSVVELGQLAGVFKKQGILLDLLDTQNDSESEQAVISGSADVGVAIGLMEVLRAYTKRAPVRIIGASLTGSANYWYVPMTSPVRTIKDMNGRTVAHSITGASGYYDVFDFMNQYRLHARPIAIGSVAAAFNQVMAGHIDVGWATPPFGIEAIEQGQIRIVARANDIPKIREKTVRVTIANADSLKKRKEVLVRFVQAYRETIEWMYSDPTAVKRYAEIAGLSEGLAQRLRDDFFPKNLLWPDKIIGLKTITRDAMNLKYIWGPLSQKQITDLIQIPASRSEKLPARSVGGWHWIFPPQ